MEDKPFSREAFGKRAALAATDEQRYARIAEAADLARSFAVSTHEAAWRGEPALIGRHLEQLREQVIAAIKAYRELGLDPEEDKKYDPR